ncbi:MAG: hypothetical protein VX951_04930 [Planctomycetota bacterium]|nr:hypothetical protein [Planctomycetota bacterium]
MANTKRFRLLPVTLGLTLCLSLQSCFTTGLWASDMRPRDKALLTPVSLTLDAVTMPVQLSVLDNYGHYHHHHHHAHGHSVRHRCR